MQTNGNVRQRFSIRKSHLGASSVLLGVSIALLSGGVTVQAEETNAVSEPPILLSQSQSLPEENQTNPTEVDVNSQTSDNESQVSTDTQVANQVNTELESQSETKVSTIQDKTVESVETPSDVNPTQAADAESTTLETKTLADNQAPAVDLTDSKVTVTATAKDKDFKRVSVHDPSIFYDEKTGTYYIFGSHLGQAKSKDLQNWTPLFNHEYENPSSVLGDLNKNLAKPFEWAGYDDADCAGGHYAIWAPDVVWNPDYKWADGSTGAYMYYFCTSSTWRRSVISYAVSKTVEGPYDYVDSLIYSGFTREDSTDGSTRNTNYKGTNIDELMAAGVIEPGFSEIWNRDNGHTYNNDYAPNAIDPNVFYDKSGKLYMSYGSWSGGIYLLELDKTTGKAIYPGKDGKTADGRHIDKYFGTHLIGGYHQSGEAPYIIYDKNTDYYYMFITYGGLGREGGYNMRLFRSKRVDGLYVDAKGKHPTYTSWTADPVNDAYGIKVMGNYNLDSLQSAYMSPGHNSAFIDKDGNWYLVNHTRFNQGTEYHEVRVHPMRMTEDNWPVALPFEYRKSDLTLTKASEGQFVGDYEFVNHGRDTSGQPLPKSRLQLNANGSVTGALTGTWTKTKKGNNYYITIKTKNVTYKGVFDVQKDESASHNPCLVFALVGNNNEVIWGVKPYKVTQKSATKTTRANQKIVVAKAQTDTTFGFKQIINQTLLSKPNTLAATPHAAREMSVSDNVTTPHEKQNQTNSPKVKTVKKIQKSSVVAASTNKTKEMRKENSVKPSLLSAVCGVVAAGVLGIFYEKKRR